MTKPSYSDIPQPIESGKVQEASHITDSHEVIIIGAGLAGLSAAIYLGRALRDVLVLDAGESLAIWEPEVQNYLGFPNGVDGRELLRRGREQAERFGAQFIQDEVERIWKEDDCFKLKAKQREFDCRRLLLATGVYHLPPKIPDVNECVGKSMFFCKDCDGYRVQGKRVIIAGHNNEAVEYALGMLIYTDCVLLMTNGEKPGWDESHDHWLREHHVPMHLDKITHVEHAKGHLKSVTIAVDVTIAADCLFTTRGDLFHNQLARQVGAELDADGQVRVDECKRTNVPGLYAAGCVTPANCQMIIAAGEGAVAAQSINRAIFEESLRDGSLTRHRERQIERGDVGPEILRK
jgi:thioredoxin reductase (NADPH)